MNTNTTKNPMTSDSIEVPNRPPILVPMLDEVDERLCRNDRRMTQHVTDELILRATEWQVATFHLQMLMDDATFAESRDRERVIALTEAARRTLQTVVSSAITGHVYAIGREQRCDYEARLKLLTTVADKPAALTPVAWSPLFRIVHDIGSPVPLMPMNDDGSLRVADNETFFTAEQAAAAMPGKWNVAHLNLLWRDTMRELGYEPNGARPSVSPEAVASEVAIGDAFTTPAPSIDPFDFPPEQVEAHNRRNASEAATQKAGDFAVGRRIFTRERDGGFVVAFDGEHVFSWGIFDDGTEPTLLYDEVGKGITTNDSPVDDEEDPGGFEAYATVNGVLDRLTNHPFVGMIVDNHDGTRGTVAMMHGTATVCLVENSRLELWERGDLMIRSDYARRDPAAVRAALSLMPFEVPVSSPSMAKSVPPRATESAKGAA